MSGRCGYLMGMPDVDKYLPYLGLKRQANCPHCSNGVAMSLRNRRWIDPDLKTPGPVQAAGNHVEEEVWSCDFCNKAVIELHAVERIRGDFGPAAASEKRILISRLWPPQEPRPLSEDAPPKVRNLFVEAGRAESVSAFRLAGVGYRSVVEEICKERGAKGRNLHAMITDLATHNVPDSVIDGFHEARMLGNDSIHDGLEYAPDEVADVAGLIEEAVLVLYTQPAERQRMAANRLARRTANKTGAATAPSATP